MTLNGIASLCRHKPIEINYSFKSENFYNYVLDITGNKIPTKYFYCDVLK